MINNLYLPKFDLVLQIGDTITISSPFYPEEIRIVSGFSTCIGPPCIKCPTHGKYLILGCLETRTVGSIICPEAIKVLKLGQPTINKITEIE